MYLELYSGGVKLPSPTSISDGNELVWSSNTGRGVTGTMLGDIIAEKTTLGIEWSYSLKYTEYLKIKNALPTKNEPFKTITIKLNTGEVIKSFAGYRGNIAGTFNFDGSYSGAQVSLIEQ